MESQETQPNLYRGFSGRITALAGVLLALLALYYVFPNIELLFDREALQRFRVEREYARLDKELTEHSVEKSSPIYHFEKPLRLGWKIIQCDEIPSVSVGNQSGYRMLFRNDFVIKYNDKSNYVMPNIDYLDLVLFPTAPQKISAIKARMTGERHPSSVPRNTFYLGEGEEFFWFANSDVRQAIRIQNKLGLQNGEDLAPAMFLAMKEVKTPKEKELDLRELGSLLGERAIPELLRIIENPEVPRDRSIATISLASIPGEKVTKALLEIYDKYDYVKEKGTGIVPYALGSNKHREDAKRVYMDMLFYAPKFDTNNSYYYHGVAISACVNFRWTEAVPFIKERMERPDDIDQYVSQRKQIWTIEGKPISDSLSKIEREIWQDAINMDTSFNREEYVRKLLEIEENEAIMLIGLRLASAWGKINNEQLIHQCGEEILCNLPKSLVLPVLGHLAGSVQGGPRGSRERAQELLELVRNAK